MDNKAFQALRDLPSKCVNDDIVFSPLKDFDEVLGFERIEVLNEMGGDLRLNGHFNRKTGGVVFNFTIKGVGAICRYCANGAAQR